VVGARDIAPAVAHRLHLEMPGWGSAPCEVLEVDPLRRLAYSFTEQWTLVWRLSPEGRGTRLFLEHSGSALDDPRSRAAFERMGPGWEPAEVGSDIS
jgi:uncharacterized protein YndB with AHSA1/START domain